MHKTKSEFLEKLEKELSGFGVTDKSEILAEFDRHFADSTALGATEAEVCEKLGDISEIAKLYADNDIFPAIAVEREPGTGGETVSGIPENNYSSSGRTYGEGVNVNPNGGNYGDTSNGTPYENSGIKIDLGGFNIGGFIGVLCVDIFVLSWAIPSLFGIFIAMLCVPLALLVSGLVVVIGSFGFGFFSPLSWISTFFLGLMLLSLGGLLGLAGAGLIKLTVKIIKGLINWHGEMIVGKTVFKKKGAPAA